MNKSQVIGYSTLILMGIGIFAFSIYKETNGKPLEALRSLFAARMTNTDGKADGSLDEMRPLGFDDHVLGSGRSPIAMVTYGDTECPYTKKFFFEMQKVMREYGSGEVVWIFRHFPNDSLHPRARLEAEATECAGRVGGKMKFWEYLQAIFTETQSHNTLDQQRLTAIAQTLEIPLDEFEACRESRMTAARVSRDADNALAIGAQGTPTTVLVAPNGAMTKIDGFSSYEEMRALINRMRVSEENTVE
jgi:protein-disulfide isomerase